MEEATWEQKLQALTHILTHQTTSPSLHSQLLFSSQIPRYIHSDYPPILHTTKSLHLIWTISFFLRRASTFGLPPTSWRSKCPYHQPPPLILARGVEAARWDDEEKRRAYVRMRTTRRPLRSRVNPMVPFLLPNLMLLSLLLWNPFPEYDR